TSAACASLRRPRTERAARAAVRGFAASDRREPVLRVRRRPARDGGYRARRGAARGVARPRPAGAGAARPGAARPPGAGGCRGGRGRAGGAPRGPGARLAPLFPPTEEKEGAGGGALRARARVRGTHLGGALPAAAGAGRDDPATLIAPVLEERTALERLT